MRIHSFLPVVALTLASSLVPQTASAACMNKFVSRTEANKQVVTVLTGKYTFDEAKALAGAIASGVASPVEWVGENGRVIARQVGPLHVTRPMPVGCDGKSSGVIFTVTFVTSTSPHGKMQLRMGAATSVTLEQQGE